MLNILNSGSTQCRDSNHASGPRSPSEGGLRLFRHQRAAFYRPVANLPPSKGSETLMNGALGGLGGIL